MYMAGHPILIFNQRPKVYNMSKEIKCTCHKFSGTHTKTKDCAPESEHRVYIVREFLGDVKRFGNSGKIHYFSSLELAKRFARLYGKDLTMIAEMEIKPIQEHVFSKADLNGLHLRAGTTSYSRCGFSYQKDFLTDDIKLVTCKQCIRFSKTVKKQEVIHKRRQGGGSKCGMIWAHGNYEHVLMRMKDYNKVTCKRCLKLK